ncbi:type III pantothenate kinase [bacterium]
MQNILLIDIGNTNIVIGLYNNKQIIKSYRFTTDVNDTVDDLGHKIIFTLFREELKPENFKAVIIACVVPQLDNKIKDAVTKYIKCDNHFVDPFNNTFISTTYPPEEIGADRIVNTAAGIELYGAPLIIVDMGTAVTMDVVSIHGKYLGGIIFQGIDLALRTLCAKAAKLPKTDLKVPSKVIGKSTAECIQSGIYHSYIGAVKHLVKQIKQEAQISQVKVVLTGGYTDLFKSETDTFDIFDKDLSLKGLAIYYEKYFK